MKKAQIQYMETIFVLLVLIVIIFIGTIIVYSFYTKSLNEKRENLQDIDSITLTSSIIRLPEITCGSNEPCLDSMKMLIFKDRSNNNYYNTLFRDMDINVEIVFPELTDAECDITKFNDINHPKNCNKFILHKSGQTTNPQIIQTPVQVYFPSKNKKALGILNIILYKK